MRFTSTRKLLAAVSLAAATVVAAPAIAHAEPAPGQPTSVPKVDKKTLESFGNFAPAILGSAATPGVDGKPNKQLLDQARAMAKAPGTPAEAAALWDQIINFIANPAAKTNATRDTTIPSKPKIQQFLYPTVGFGCLPKGGNSVGMALTTSGPQQAPYPGPKKFQAGFVYTALGAGDPIKSVKNPPLYVSWINLDNGRTGQTRLVPNPKIERKKSAGAVFTGIAKTGSGRLLTAVYGNVTHKANGKYYSCGIVPTVGTSYINR